MEPATCTRLNDSQRQAEIKQQIALLQAQLSYAQDAPRSPPRRKANAPAVLAPATPSPKKRKLHQERRENIYKPVPLKQSIPLQQYSLLKPVQAPAAAPVASTFISQLSSLTSRTKQEPEPIARSGAFSEVPAVPSESSGYAQALERDDRLALVEELEIGPAEHKAPFDDPYFEKLEPNSGIHLLSRKLPHDDLQDYLRGRYYLSPSRLYSVVRLLPNKQGYDVPVVGDWVTIAVVAERGPIKLTSGQATDNKGSDDEGKGKKRKAGEEQPRKPAGKKYMNIKLVDFGHRSRSSSTTKATIKGDALLTLLLFESDTFDRLKEDDGTVKKIYKGGSRGAFEEYAKLREGMVVALLNPKILKPFQRTGDSPHPVSNLLALTPESAQSIAIIGQARDLGMCAVQRRDGKVCGGWCDKRVSEVCEYHVQTAVQSRRAARPEFSIGTSGMSTNNRRKPAYDPTRQWGLKPEQKPGADNDATYVLSGHVVSSRGPEYIHETVGRESQSRAKRKLDEKEAERTLQQLLNRDCAQDGAAAVVKKARMAAAAKSKFTSKKDKGKGKDDQEIVCETAQTSAGDAGAGEAKRRSYSVDIVKKLGFDPTLKAGQKRPDAGRKRSVLLPPQGEVRLGPPPGPRIRSGVSAPQSQGTAPESASSVGEKAALDDAEVDDLEAAERAVFGRPIGLLLEGADHRRQVVADDSDSDSELEVESP